MCLDDAFLCVNGCQGLATTATALEGEPASSGAMAFDSMGRPSVLMKQRSSLFYAERVDGVWKATYTGITAGSAALALDAEDRPHLVYEVTFLGPPRFTTAVGYAFRDDGGVWHQREIETRFDGSMGGLGIANDAAGTVHIT